jgi:murein endopeptidase
VARPWLLAALVAALLGLAAVALADEPLPDGSETVAPAPEPPPLVSVPGAAPAPTPTPPPADRAVAWRRSRALGLPTAGRLARGVQLPVEGRDFFTWDPVRKRRQNRGWRRWGTDRLVRTLLAVLRDYRAEHPGAPRVGVGDLSRPRGGEFGREFGGLGHLSHQNGLDVDVYYPRRDGRERKPQRPGLVDEGLAQALVDGFVAAGATHVFVGPHLRLGGPRAVVSPLVHHDDHLHVRLP